MMRHNSSTLFRVWPCRAAPDPRRPIRLEIGPGRGDFLLSLAANHPRTQIVAIEYKGKRFEKLIPRVERQKLTHVILYCGRAEEVVPLFIPLGSLSHIYINFPDPWPKRRHARRRLLQDGFLQVLIKRLRPEGRMTIVTDHRGYFEEVAARLKALDCRLWRGRIASIKRLYSSYLPSLYEIKKRKAGSFIFKLVVSLPRRGLVPAQRSENRQQDPSQS